MLEHSRGKSSGLVETIGQDAEKRAGFLDQTRWANDFSWKEIESLASYMVLCRVAKGETLFQEGAEGDSLIIIVKGSVHIEKENMGRKKKGIATLGSGQTLGEMSLIDGERRSATAVAATDLLLLVLSKPGLDQLIEEKPGLAVKFIMKTARFLSQRLRKTSGDLADFL